MIEIYNDENLYEKSFIRYDNNKNKKKKKKSKKKKHRLLKGSKNDCTKWAL